MRRLKSVVLLFAAVALFGFQQTDPWRPADLVEPASAAAKLKAKPADQPLLLQVGFQALYKSTRIPGSKYAGPGSTAEGVANLEAQVKGVAHDRRSLSIAAVAPWRSVRTSVRRSKSCTIWDSRMCRCSRSRRICTRIGTCRDIRWKKAHSAFSASSHR